MVVEMLYAGSGRLQRLLVIIKIKSIRKPSRFWKPRRFEEAEQAKGRLLMIGEKGR